MRYSYSYESDAADESNLYIICLYMYEILILIAKQNLYLKINAVFGFKTYLSIQLKRLHHMYSCDYQFHCVYM